ncbi:MAG: hypothetical protein ACRDO9_07120, partial [Gaiellales bacterium]
RRSTLQRDKVEVPREWVGGQALPKRSDDAAPVAVGKRAKVPLSTAAQFNLVRHRGPERMSTRALAAHIEARRQDEEFRVLRNSGRLVLRTNILRKPPPG